MRASCVVVSTPGQVGGALKHPGLFFARSCSRRVYPNQIHTLLEKDCPPEGERGDDT